MNRLFCSRKALVTGAAITVAVNSGIAVVLWLSRLGSFAEQMVYSQAIGLSIWALVNGGAAWLSRPTDPGGFPRGFRAVVLVPSATLLGIANGTWLGDLYSGRSSWALGAQSPKLAGSLLIMSLSVGLALTLLFYLKGRSSYFESELQRTKAQQAEAQLRLLESQLEPHMLFNTLANLRVLISLDPAKAQTMLDHLIAYLRSTLMASRASTHPLAQEFERLNDYLALMTIRMGPRLRVSLDLPEPLRSVPVPPLLLQPLVENAISHGLEPNVGGGEIVVRAWAGESMLHLQVADSGVGLGPDGAPAVATAAQGTGYGLTHVRERLATAYGPKATLRLHANSPSGTCAEVQIPLTEVGLT